MTRERRWLRSRVGLVVLIGALVVGGGVALLLANTLTLRRSADTTIRTDVYLLRVVGADADGLAAALEGLARRPVGRHPDDVAVIALRFLGQGAERNAVPELAGRLYR